MTEQANLAIARSLLVPSLLGVSTQQETGSYSQSRSHFDVFLIVITDARRDVGEDVITNQLIRRLTDLNFVVEEYPKFKFNDFTGDDLGILFEIFNKAVTSGIVDKVPEDEIHVRQMARFPERTLEDIEAQIEENKAMLPDPLKKPDDDDDDDDDDDPAKKKPDDDDDTPGAKKFQQQRRPTKLEKKVDFKAMDSDLNALQSETSEALVEVFGRMEESVLSIVLKKQQAGNLTTAFVNSLELKHKGDLNRVLREFVGEGYRMGTAEGQALLPKRRFQRVGPGIAPEAALAFFESKAFEISGVLKETLKGDIKNILFNAIKTGESADVTNAKIREAFVPYVGDPNALDEKGEDQRQPFRVSQLIRTNSTEAFSEGIKSSVAEEIEDGFVIGFLYSAILDSRVTEVCRFLDGKIFRPDSVALNQLTPANHHNCRSILIPLTTDDRPVRFITQAQIGRGTALKGKGF